MRKHIKIQALDAESFRKHMEEHMNRGFIAGLRSQDLKKYPNIDIREIIRSHMHRLYWKQLVREGEVTEQEYLEAELGGEI